MKIKGNRRTRNLDYRYLTEMNSHRKWSKEETDIAVNGVPYGGNRYPLCYVFWGDIRLNRKVMITLTGETGTLIGESIITRQSPNFEDSRRGIVQIGERITDLDYSVLQFV